MFVLVKKAKVVKNPEQSLLETSQFVAVGAGVDGRVHGSYNGGHFRASIADDGVTVHVQPTTLLDL